MWLHHATYLALRLRTAAGKHPVNGATAAFPNRSRLKAFSYRGEHSVQGKRLMNDFLNLIGRILIARLFIGGAVQKMADPGPVQAMLLSVQVPFWLVWPMAAMNRGHCPDFRTACSGVGHIPCALLHRNQLFPLAVACRSVTGNHLYQELGNRRRAVDPCGARTGTLGLAALMRFRQNAAKPSNLYRCPWPIIERT